MDYLDKWVYQYGDYVQEDFIPIANGGNKLFHIRDASKMGIQQVRSEIKEFIQVLGNNNLHGSIIEIGIGMYGGTHILWRQIFNQVTTIEMSKLLVLKFKLTEKLDGRSNIIIGSSHDIRTFNKVKGKYDVLFIDGDHSYEGIKKDYEMYRGLVRKGGIIAFHDVVCTIKGFGIKQFIDELSIGKINDKKHDIKIICHSKNVGIGYEVVDW
jgi:hypothetical protein